MDDPRDRASNVEVYHKRLSQGWRLVDVDSTDSEIILTLERRGNTFILPMDGFEAAKLAGFDTMAAEIKLRDILRRLKT